MGDGDAARTEARRAVQLAVWSRFPGENNHVCWFGSRTGFAADVLDACELAVELAPDSAALADSRGLAHALTGHYGRAIADFEFFANAPGRDAEDVEDRKRWIAALENGNDPFDETTLQRLLNRPF